MRSVLRNVSAVLAGFGIWIAASVIFALISVFVWGNSPDRYLSIAIQCWTGTTAAFAFAITAKEKIAPMLSDRTFVLVLGAIVLPWAAFSMISGVNVDFKAIALAAHGMAIFVVFRYGLTGL